MKKILTLICTLLCANVLLAQTRFFGGDLEYEVTSTNPAEVMVYWYQNNPTTANIPATVTFQGTTYSVTSIDADAFYNCSSLTSVTIPNSVTSIGNGVFYNCSSLTSVTCLRSNSPSLGSDVFYGTPNNKTLTVPCGYESEYNDWQTTIWASIDCIPTIESRFTIGDLTYEIISETEVKLYDANSSITTANIPETVTYQGTTYSVTSIGNSAFFECIHLTSVTIPNSVTYIDWYAFQNCSSLTSITIPNSVTSIRGEVFYGCSSLTSVTIPNSVTSIGNNTFAYCSSLTSVNIPNSVTSIGERAFAYCSSLTSVNIPNSVTSIGERAFKNCSSLTSVTIGNSVTSIGDSAFSYCSSLTSLSIDWTSVPNIFSNIGFNSTLQNLTLGENVTSIASGAFNNYSFLQNVTCLATTPPTLADNTVFPYPNIATLTVPCGTLDAYSSATSFWNMFFNGRISENGYNVEVSVNDETFGSVAVESDCSTATLTATANEGYVFLSWNDENTDNPRTVALTSDTSFTANFALIDESSLLEAEAESISFFPNPTKSEITFSQAIEKVEVIDLIGKTILTFTNAKTINIESLPTGAYYLRLTNNDKAVLRKLIKE